MRRRILGLFGIIICTMIAYLAWNYIPEGQGLKRNVLRSIILGAMIPWFLYSIYMLLRSSHK